MPLTRRKEKWGESINLANCKNLPHICRQGTYFQPTHPSEAPVIAKDPAQPRKADRNEERMWKKKVIDKVLSDNSITILKTKCRSKRKTVSINT